MFPFDDVIMRLFDAKPLTNNSDNDDDTIAIHRVYFQTISQKYIQQWILYMKKMLIYCQEHGEDKILLKTHALKHELLWYAVEKSGINQQFSVGMYVLKYCFCQVQ